MSRCSLAEKKKKKKNEQKGKKASFSLLRFSTSRPASRRGEKGGKESNSRPREKKKEGPTCDSFDHSSEKGYEKKRKKSKNIRGGKRPIIRYPIRPRTAAVRCMGKKGKKERERGGWQHTTDRLYPPLAFPSMTRHVTGDKRKQEKRKKLSRGKERGSPRLNIDFLLTAFRYPADVRRKKKKKRDPLGRR